jgi:hypothetical protein
VISPFWSLYGSLLPFVKNLPLPKHLRIVGQPMLDALPHYGGGIKQLFMRELESKWISGTCIIYSHQPSAITPAPHSQIEKNG